MCVFVYNWDILSLLMIPAVQSCHLLLLMSAIELSHMLAMLFTVSGTKWSDICSEVIILFAVESYHNFFSGVVSCIVCMGVMLIFAVDWCRPWTMPFLRSGLIGLKGTRMLTLTSLVSVFDWFIRRETAHCDPNLRNWIIAVLSFFQSYTVFKDWQKLTRNIL